MMSPVNPARIEILIVDDLAQVRQGLRTLLELTDDLMVVGEAANGLEAIQMAEQLQPDIVLMDLTMPGLDGFEATRQIKQHHWVGGVIALTIRRDDEARWQAIRAGADAFVEKSVAVEILIETIKQVWHRKLEPGL